MRLALTPGQKGDAPQAEALIEGLPAEIVSQVASALGCRPGTVVSQASRALVKLRALVGRATPLEASR